MPPRSAGWQRIASRVYVGRRPSETTADRHASFAWQERELGRRAVELWDRPADCAADQRAGERIAGEMIAGQHARSRDPGCDRERAGEHPVGKAGARMARALDLE